MSFYGNSRNLDYNLIIEKNEAKDGYLKYEFYQGINDTNKRLQGEINIPLDRILDKVEIESEGADKYMVFYFRDSEDTPIDPVKLNVKDLNEFDSIGDSETIQLTLDENNKLTATIKQHSITKDLLAEDVVTSIENSVGFKYDEDNKRLKIFYTNKKEDTQ